MRWTWLIGATQRVATFTIRKSLSVSVPAAPVGGTGAAIYPGKNPMPLQRDHG
jgi:hypothetical protein